MKVSLPKGNRTRPRSKVVSRHGFRHQLMIIHVLSRSSISLSLWMVVHHQTWCPNRTSICRPNDTLDDDNHPWTDRTVNSLVVPLCRLYGGCPLVLHGLFRTSTPIKLELPPRSPRRRLVADGSRGFSSQIIMFSDLECDYINPIDLCNKLNTVSHPPTSLCPRPLSPCCLLLRDTVSVY